MITFFSIVLGIYALLMFWLLLGLKKVANRNYNVTGEFNSFTIVIPFRNEAENLPRLITSLVQLDYPRENFEIIFIDDESSDKSTLILKKHLSTTSLNFSILKNKRTTNAPKKDAITLAVNKAKYSWIVTTDADCEVPINWLKLFNRTIQNSKPLMICAPIQYCNNETFIENYQYLENLSLQGVALGTYGWRNPILCNGANLAFYKDAFYKVGGYEGNTHIASGDDIFLLEKMKKSFPKRVSFIQDSLGAVITKPELNWRALLQQRIRWASKIKNLNNYLSKGIGLLVFFTNFFLVILLLCSFFFTTSYSETIIFILTKWGIDFIFLKVNSRKFKQKFSTLGFFGSSFLYPFFTILVIFKSVKGTYSWKNRNF